ncbi:MAG TPA: ATP-binding protein [Streptosporangiaceae bacterium]
MTPADHTADRSGDAASGQGGGTAPFDVSTATGLAMALRDLLEASYHLATQAGLDTPVAAKIGAHLGCELKDMAFVEESFPLWEHANLQRGIDAYLAEHSPAAEWFGLSGMNRDHEDLATMITRSGPGYEISAVTHGTAAIGPDEAMEVVQFGLVLSTAPDDSPVVIGLRATDRFGPSECRMEILAAQRIAAVAVRGEIERLMRVHDVFRGKVLSFGVSEHRGNELLSFLPRPDLGAEQVVLPAGVLDSIERHVISITSHAERLRAVGQHLKRGLLLHGFPGTGKTHTVRYLMGRMSGCTVILMTGQAMRFIEPAAALARRLQPSMLVLEDVDLVAQDRSFGPDSSPLLFSLLEAMDGIGADADVTFVLTTNRAGMLERALVDRPGRVDLAVEIPKPDEQARERLLRLYAGTLELEADLAPVIAATEGVTASFIKELLRRAVLAAFRASDDVRSLTDADLAAAAEELSEQRQALTRSLLGHSPADGEAGDDTGGEVWDDIGGEPQLFPAPPGGRMAVSGRRAWRSAAVYLRSRGE